MLNNHQFFFGLFLFLGSKTLNQILSQFKEILCNLITPEEVMYRLENTGDDLSNNETVKALKPVFCSFVPDIVS